VAVTFRLKISIKNAFLKKTHSYSLKLRRSLEVFLVLLPGLGGWCRQWPSFQEPTTKRFKWVWQVVILVVHQPCGHHDNQH